MRLSRRHPQRAGFTLVELLTVVGIIALLIGILVPSLSKARDQAKKVRTSAMLSSVEKGLEMFQNDFRIYPESRVRNDAINGLPGTSADGVELSGAHWLVRSLWGVEGNGVDSKGIGLQDRASVGTGNGMPYAPDYLNLDRRGVYLDAGEGKILARDTDGSRFPNQSTNPLPTGRFVMVDSFEGPVLYYKANSKARLPFGNDSIGTGVYNETDNLHFTRWDFAFSGLGHGMGTFGVTSAAQVVDPDAVHDSVPPADARGRTFVNYLHDENVHEAGQQVKAVRAESFVLITPGKDGLYGTDDDINSFDR